MDAEMKKKWVAALRSSNYTQGRFSLKDKDNRFCCLGVLCDISGEGYWEFGGENRIFYRSKDGLRYTYEPPVSLQQKLGVEADDIIKLISMNDGINHTRKTFKEIADHIEKEM